MSGVIKLPDNDDDGRRKKTKKQCFCSCFRRVSRIFMMLLGSALTIYVCIISSERYFLYWVQTTIDRTDVHVSEIAFPAITICPTHLSLTNLNSTNSEHKKLNRLNRLYNLVHGIQLKTRDAEHITEEDLIEFQDYYNITLSDIASIINPNYTCKELFAQCLWRRRAIDCCSIFKPYHFGVACYTFNSLYAADSDPTWPWSVAGSGVNSGLNVKLNRNLGKDRLESVGVIVQEPSQYLGTSVTYSSDDRIVIPLTPLKFSAEPAVKARPVEMRYCYFADELMLNGLSRSLCIHTCHVNYMAKMCDCRYEIPMPIQQHFKKQLSNLAPNRTCTFQDLKCFQKHKVSLFSMSNIIEESQDYVFNTTDCMCFPNCDHIQYHASIYTDSLCTKRKEESVLEIDVYFQEETLFSYRSTLHITLLDLIVSFGGVAGLILGISVFGGINALLDRITCCGQSAPRRLI